MALIISAVVASACGGAEPTPSPVQPTRGAGGQRLHTPLPTKVVTATLAATASPTLSATPLVTPTATSSPTLSPPTSTPLPTATTTNTPTPLPTPTPAPTPTPTSTSPSTIYDIVSVSYDPDCSVTEVRGNVFNSDWSPASGVYFKVWNDWGWSAISNPSADGLWDIYLYDKPREMTWYVQAVEGDQPVSPMVIVHTDLDCEKGIQRARINWKKARPPLPVYPYRVVGIESHRTCGVTALSGTLLTAGWSPVGGSKVVVWNDYGWSHTSEPSVAGFWEVFLSDTPKKGTWYVQVVENGQAVSSVVKVVTGEDCQRGPQRIQIDWQHLPTVPDSTTFPYEIADVSSEKDCTRTEVWGTVVGENWEPVSGAQVRIWNDYDWSLTSEPSVISRWNIYLYDKPREMIWYVQLLDRGRPVSPVVLVVTSGDCTVGPQRVEINWKRKPRGPMPPEG
ncbi:MAG: hypothetical protein E3J21_09610 [Anaerolineales bacterium]|nr:MAG: hypothetical protein E3J21_09610 [Anaerolineales bacterium]